jgi:luciferase-like monooxygenase
VKSRGRLRYVSPFAGGSALCGSAGDALGLDRRTPLQLARRAFLSRPRALLYRGTNPAHPARAGRDMLPLHHPIRVAEQRATLDPLSNGRVDFAAGRGYDKREYLPFHVLALLRRTGLRGYPGVRRYPIAVSPAYLLQRARVGKSCGLRCFSSHSRSVHVGNARRVT